jgi:hypothetical protein
MKSMEVQVKRKLHVQQRRYNLVYPGNSNKFLICNESQQKWTNENFIENTEIGNATRKVSK